MPDKTYPAGTQTSAAPIPSKEPPYREYDPAKGVPPQQANRQVPTMGRIVFYTVPGPHTNSGKIESLGVVPALIGSTNHDGSLNLWLFGDVQVAMKKNVQPGGPNGDVPAAGCWHWPPRV